MGLGIVVLNYHNYTDTIECIESILVYRKFVKHIVIVDNNSPNESYIKLQEKFAAEVIISIVKNKKNIGYSRGNNNGIMILRRMGIPNILVLNNDTVIQDSMFFENIVKMEFTEDIGAIGPRIVGRDNLEQNPIYKKVSFKQTTKDFIISNYPIMYSKFWAKRKTKKNTGVSELKKSNEYYLHGAAILLTENYFKKYSALYPYTFLYYEENILAYLFKRAKLKMSFCDRVFIYHKEDQSSNLVFTNPTEAKRNFLKKSLFSALLLRFLTTRNISFLIDMRARKDMEFIE